MFTQHLISNYMQYGIGIASYIPHLVQSITHTKIQNNCHEKKPKSRNNGIRIMITTVATHVVKRKSQKKKRSTTAATCRHSLMTSFSVSSSSLFATITLRYLRISSITDNLLRSVDTLSRLVVSIPPV